MTTLGWNRRWRVARVHGDDSGSGVEGHSIKMPESPGAAPVLAIWFGLVTGLLELASIHARNHFSGWSSLNALQISRHFPWMIPVRQSDHLS